MVELRLGLVMPRKLPALSLSPDQQQQIRQWLTAHGTPQQVALRGRIILAAAEGQPETTIASQLGTHRKTVRLWRGRFAQHGLESLWEVAPGRGRKATYGPERIKAIVEGTLQSKPKGMTHWSCRLMAKSQGVSKSTVSSIWRSYKQRVRRGSFFSVEELKKAIMEFLEAWNDDPKPFIWTATVESIVEKLHAVAKLSNKSNPAARSPAARRSRKDCLLSGQTRRLPAPVDTAQRHTGVARCQDAHDQHKPGPPHCPRVVSAHLPCHSREE